MTAHGRRRVEPPAVPLADLPCWCSRWDLPHVHTIGQCLAKTDADTVAALERHLAQYRRGLR